MAYAPPHGKHHPTALGALHYRAGRLDSAVTTLTEVVATSTNANDKGSPAYPWFFLAMAHHDLGHADEARTWLDKGVNWAEEEFNGPVITWNRRLTLQLLRQEAEQRLGIEDEASGKEAATQND